MNQFENGLKKLLIGQLSELYFCENQLLKALENMSKAATAPKLKGLFLEHRNQTQGHVERLQAVFAELRAEPSAYPCRALQGLLEDGTWMMHRLKGDPHLDEALVAAAQKVELFEIASYRSAIHLAEMLGLAKVVELCRSILDEEMETDDLLKHALDRNAEPHGVAAR